MPYLANGSVPYSRGQAIALACIVGATALRGVTGAFEPDGMYFTFLFPAIVVAGLFGGTWSGLSTAFFGGLLTAYIWMPPRFSFELNANDFVLLAAFWFSAATVLLLIGFIQLVLEKLRTAQYRAETIAREMQHRVQNSLTLVQAIARQTFAATNDAAKEIFMARLAALGSAQGLIGESPDEKAELETLIQRVLIAFDANRFACTGPPVRVDRDAGISLALLLHELATNSAKYGALSVSTGVVNISWPDKQPGQKTTIEWKERFGPTVMEPSRAGFGSKLFRSDFTRGTVETKIGFEPDGLRCEMTFSTLPRAVNGANGKAPGPGGAQVKPCVDFVEIAHPTNSTARPHDAQTSKMERDLCAHS